MVKKYDTIYLDWDGVLWNFKQAFCDWNGVAAPNTDKWEFYEALSMTADKFHEVLSELPQEFWQQEKYILPHAHDLVAWARANAENVFILTVAPEWTTAQGKQNLARAKFDLNLYSVAKAEEKLEFAKKGCLLIDDKPSSVVRFAREVKGVGGGYVWPANYNQGLDWSWYFQKSWLHEHKAHWALTGPDRSDILKCMKVWKEAGRTQLEIVEDVRAATGLEELKDMKATPYPVSDVSVELGKVEEKPKLDYDAMDEAERRKKTPMYSGLLAYFPDALALVARNSMVGHVQHNPPNTGMYWDRTKSADEMDAMIRHMADHSKDPYDADGTLHMSKVAWRALAFVQKFLEEQNDEIN